MGYFSVTQTPIKDLLVIEPQVFGDERGYFFESYNARDFADHNIAATFVQDNQSQSVRGVLRGLHYQVNHPQAKLVRVLSGEVFDVAVDIRPESPSFGKWFGVKLTGENKKQFWIPTGFAHGFLTLSEKAVFAYKCTDYYHPEDEAGIIWNDADINIEWPLENLDPILSAKDKLWLPLKQTVLAGNL